MVMVMVTSRTTTTTTTTVVVSHIVAYTNLMGMRLRIVLFLMQYVTRAVRKVISRVCVGRET
jgi:hypothetical protein